MQQSVGNLSRIEKIGQMFIVGLNGTETSGEIIELIQTYKIGGILLRQKNLQNVEQMQKLINDLKNANLGNSVPLFIAISEETGRGNRLPKDIRRLPAIKYIAENSDKSVIYESQKLIANMLKKLGINMNFAPLLDMGGMVEGVPLGDRCISTNNTTIVSAYGVQTLNAHKENGIIAVPKYFPSHTSTKSDRSNIIIPHVKKSIAKLEQFDLVPFKYLIDEGVETMLIGHVQLSKLNMFTPATLSERVVTKLLKGRYNFEGLSISDDLCATSIRIQYGLKNAVRKAIMAGNEILIISNSSKVKSILEDVEKQIDRGTFNEKVIDLRVQKILDLKAKYDLNDNEMAPIDINSENEKIDALITKIRQLV